MKKKRRIYQPCVFDSRVIMPDEIERIHKDLLQFERIEAISDPMRELIEELWPELVHKLPPKTPQAWPWSTFRAGNTSVDASLARQKTKPNIFINARLAVAGLIAATLPKYRAGRTAAASAAG
jgi:hypothetical protein